MRCGHRKVGWSSERIGWTERQQEEDVVVDRRVDYGGREGPVSG